MSQSSGLTSLARNMVASVQGTKHSSPACAPHSTTQPPSSGLMVYGIGSCCGIRGQLNAVATSCMSTFYVSAIAQSRCLCVKVKFTGILKQHRTGILVVSHLNHLSDIVYAPFAKHFPSMCLSRACRDTELLPNFTAGKAPKRQLHDLDLSRRQGRKGYGWHS